jgi:hypothetical protein
LQQIDAELAGDPAGDPAKARLLQIMRTILASGLFDAAFYLQSYIDVSIAGIDPLWHYVQHGDNEGRTPNPFFSPQHYRRRAGEAAMQADANALEHYINCGEMAGLRTHVLFSPRDYLEANPALTEYVDRPLFHYLKIGRAAGLKCSRTGIDALAEAPGIEQAIRFEESGQRDLYSLMRFRQALSQRLGVSAGFSLYKHLLPLPDTDHIRHKQLESQRAFACCRAEAFLEIAPGGQRIVIEPPHVIGHGNHRKLEGTARSSYLACLKEARVRGMSSMLEVEEVVLFDYEGAELVNFDTEFEFDSAVFHGTNEAAWVIRPKDEISSIQLAQAFTLLSPRSISFGHWMWESLPKYAAARMASLMPPVPVLIDAAMPQTHRQSLELFFPDTEVVEIPAHVTARVQRLWCASTQHFASLIEKRNERFRWDYLVAPPERFRAIFNDLVRRADSVSRPTNGPERVFLARREFRHRKLVNREAIEVTAKTRGFSVLYPEDLDFVEQFRLMRSVRFLIVPAGSAVFLACFSKPGTKLLVLNNPYTADLPLEAAIYSAVGVHVTVLTGRFVTEHVDWPEWGNYEIDEKVFGGYLDTWLVAGMH